MTYSDGEQAMAFMLKAHKYPFVQEFQFHPTRKWRTDFAIGHPSISHFDADVARKLPRSDVLLVEVEGVLHGDKAGRHQRAKGYRKDCEKYAEAMLHGWRVLRVTPDMITDASAIDFIERYFGADPTSGAS